MQKCPVSKIPGYLLIAVNYCTCGQKPRCSFFLTTSVINLYEYERQGPAPRRGLAPPVLIFQTSPSCNIFTKIPKFWRNRCQP